jgi:hypothetical protein
LVSSCVDPDKAAPLFRARGVVFATSKHAVNESGLGYQTLAQARTMGVERREKMR